MIQTENNRFYPDENGMGIIVVGYPKSGNTWITRLVADVVGCPVAGFWNSPNHNEIAIEGAERKSPHRVYKSYHSAKTFFYLPDNYRIIYLVRDPRDVATSGAHYFNVEKFWEQNPELRHFDKYEAVVHDMLHGSGRGWLSKSWIDHVIEFTEFNSTLNANQNLLFVRYEDMVENPILELMKVLVFLGLNCSIDKIENSIYNQSFSVIKAREVEKGKQGRPEFFRKGKVGSFREELKVDLIEKIEAAWFDVMAKFGYELTYNSVGDKERVANFLLDKIEILRPKPSPFPLIRIGGDKDGAYLLPNDLHGIKACFSPGVSNRKDFEDELLDGYDIVSHMCDYSSDPENFRTPLKPGQTFKKKWLDVDGGDDSISLEDWVQELAPDASDDLILQMDIEGAEYRNLLQTPDAILRRFRIIVIELHGLKICNRSADFNKEIGPLLQRLEEHFLCVHAHPNNCCGDIQVAGSKLNLPNVHELTFLRRDRWEGVAEADCYAPMLPHPLDIPPNVPNKPPIFLNEHWLASGKRAPESTIKLLTDQLEFLERSLKQAQSPAQDILTNLHRLAQHTASALPILTFRPNAETLVDLAAGKPFTLSSQHGASPKKRQVREQRPFLFHTDEGRNQSITIDLEAEVLLFELRIANRTDTCRERARCLFYCLHNEPKPDLHQGFPVVIDEAFLTKADQISVTDLRGERARYVTIFSPEKTFLHLSSIQILGIPNND